MSDLDAELRGEPWLASLPGSWRQSLEAARQRFDEAQDAAKRELRRQHVPIRLRARTANGVITTSYKPS